ncbi:uncharacterized protein M421DRAFT_97728 [Didymella exigua CBS 183.55]|uniref:MFS general substrate transporter n=1 Tax=Didymella exigua CBS 183.55 TaxID=1150837 RepID=A0A6A5S2U3_9PLEO|nr:uncharacterized protein M421DRAFT_97728 [Didymella exigua CBS 183.55]KAF1933648.1 hypothetical protein M421DRAFT_97728 [Didymella exigua CBS 183.55]
MATVKKDRPTAISINSNASTYSHGVSFVHEQYGVSEQDARIPQALFLIAYGFGCELWLSLSLVNLWQIPCALGKSYATILVFRILGGLSTAGGSVTLGECAVAFLVLSSAGGSVVGVIIGAFVKARMSLPCIYGPNEIRSGHRISFKECGAIFWRYSGKPFCMFFTGHIVVWISLLSDFGDALIFTFLEGFKPLVSLAPLEFLGMMGFTWTILGPGCGIPWIAPMTFTVLVAIVNYAIYQSSVYYETVAYGPYATSTTGGNDLARDIMANVAALYSTPLYKNMPGRLIQYASTLLACLLDVVTKPIYFSRFAQSLDRTREERTKKRKSSLVRLQEEIESERLERV